MSKYTIVGKSGRGNIGGSVYEIAYQVEDYSGTYKADFICLGALEGRKGRYAFLEGNEYPFIITKQDREEFLEELKAFQLGASYRKTHPIKKSSLEVLREKKKEYLSEIDKINDKIEQEENRLKQQKAKEYLSDIDRNSLYDFESKLKTIFFDDCRYILLPDNFSINQNILIYDTELKKVVKVYEMHSHKILTRDPIISEIIRWSNTK